MTRGITYFKLPGSILLFDVGLSEFHITCTLYIVLYWWFSDDDDNDGFLFIVNTVCKDMLFQIIIWYLVGPRYSYTRTRGRGDGREACGDPRGSRVWSGGCPSRGGGHCRHSYHAVPALKAPPHLRVVGGEDDVEVVAGGRDPAGGLLGAEGVQGLAVRVGAVKELECVPGAGAARPGPRDVYAGQLQLDDLSRKRNRLIN